MKPDHFALTNPEWERFIERTVAKVQEELGLEKQKLQSHLYDLLLYEPGSFFLPHRDGEKLDRMVATLVVVLPSSHEGGELVVRHEGQERTIDFGGPADRHVPHPLRRLLRRLRARGPPLEEGISPLPGLQPDAGEIEETHHRAAGLGAHRGDRTAPPPNGRPTSSAEKLVITLDHQYTQDGLAWDALKGVDRAKAQRPRATRRGRPGARPIWRC